MDYSSTDTSDDDIKTPLHSPTISRDYIASLPLENSFDDCKKDNPAASLLESQELCRWRGSPFVTRKNKIRTNPPKIEPPPSTQMQIEENHSLLWFLWEFIRILFTFFFGLLRVLLIPNIYTHMKRFLSIGTRLQVSRLQQQMDTASNYSEWEAAATKMDELKG